MGKTGETGTKNSSRWPRILGISAIILVILGLSCILWVRHNLYAKPFHVTKLSDEEQQTLNEKLERLTPERYVEDPEKRQIRITEKELNYLVARDEEQARRIAIDLSDDLVSVKLIVPLDRDFPVLGGKTLRLNCGVTFRQEGSKPVVALQGVSIGGVPIPNAWLGNLKNVDLVQEFGSQGGFWKIFSEGVETVKVSEGSLLIKLKE